MKKSLALLLCVTAWSLPPGAQAFTIDFNRLKDVVQKTKALKEPSETDEIELGKGISANLLGAAPLVDDAALQHYVNRVGKWIALHSERPNLPWRFGVLDDDDINAFAMPGGVILLTRGLLLRMRDESELAGVLAHEIVHVVDKHALKTMKQGAKWGLAADALSVYAESKGRDSYSKLVDGGTEIYIRGLDKEDEYAADRAGVVLAARAGYDPYGLASVLQTLASINPQDSAVALMFKTHPDAGERLKLLTDAMEGRLDHLAGQTRAAGRFAEIMEAHVARYRPRRSP